MVGGINAAIGMNNVGYTRGVQAYNSNNMSITGLNFKGGLKEDSFEFQHVNNKTPLTTKDKQEIKHQARNNATGWSAFGGVFSTLYYGLRSDETIAKKYNLDVEQDKDFIKEIRKDQTMWTLPAVAGLGILPWIYSKCQDASDMTIKSERA